MNRQNYGYQYKQAQINNQYQNKYEPVKKINDHQKFIQIKNYNSNPIKINNQNKLNYPDQKQINLINKNLESNKTQEKLKINNKNTNKKNYESNENFRKRINNCFWIIKNFFIISNRIFKFFNIHIFF